MKVKVSRWRLYRALKAAALFRSSDKTRKHLQCYRFDVTPEGLEICSTNGEAALRLKISGTIVGKMPDPLFRTHVYVAIPDKLDNPRPLKHTHDELVVVKVRAKDVVLPRSDENEERPPVKLEAVEHHFPELTDTYMPPFRRDLFDAEVFGINGKQLTRLGAAAKALTDNPDTIWRCQPPANALDPLRFDLVVGLPVDESGSIRAELAVMPSRLLHGEFS